MRQNLRDLIMEDRKGENRMNHLRLLTLLNFLPLFELEFEMALPAPEAAHSWYALSILSFSFSAFLSSLSFEVELLNNDPNPNPDDFLDLVLWEDFCLSFMLGTSRYGPTPPTPLWPR